MRPSRAARRDSGPRRLSRLVQPEDAVHGLPLGRLDELVVCDAHGVQRPFQFALPVFQKSLEPRKGGREVIFLPDEKL